MQITDSGPSYQISTPSVEDVALMYDPPAAEFCKSATGEVYAIASCSYSGLPVQARDSLLNLCLQSAWDYGPGNVWILPTMARLTYPFAPLYAIAGLLQTEKVTGRRADWVVWLDDDVIVPKGLIRKLREAADPQDRPFVAALGFDRFPPFRGAAWTNTTVGNAIVRRQWVSGPTSDPNEMEAPTTGVHKVDCTGLCAAIFHRSFFDRVPQPWFSSLPPVTSPEGRVSSKINPDAWLCQQCEQAGVPIYVTCDVTIGHIGLPIILTPQTAQVARMVWGKPQ